VKRARQRRSRTGARRIPTPIACHRWSSTLFMHTERQKGTIYFAFSTTSISMDKLVATISRPGCSANIGLKSSSVWRVLLSRRLLSRGMEYLSGFQPRRQPTQNAVRYARRDEHETDVATRQPPDFRLVPLLPDFLYGFW
jgi:hypothetical protein